MPWRPRSTRRGSGAGANLTGAAEGTWITTASLGAALPGGRKTVTPEADSTASALLGPDLAGSALATGSAAGAGSRRVMAATALGSPPCGSPKIARRLTPTTSPAARQPSTIGTVTRICARERHR